MNDQTAQRRYETRVKRSYGIAKKKGLSGRDLLDFVRPFIAPAEKALRGVMARTPDFTGTYGPHFNG